jgi:hypothetical protein
MRRAWMSFALGVLCAGSAHAQDFVPPTPLWPPHSACALLEHGLPSPEGGPVLEASSVRWYGLSDLTTRSIALAGSWRLLRAAFGLSQTGSPELGWTAGALAFGVANETGGVAVRATARRDRTSEFAFTAVPADAGIEIGAGGWLEAGEGLVLWTSVPELWLSGAAPPLRRALAIGGALTLGDLEVWLARRAVPGLVRGMRGEHAFGVAMAARPLAVWLEAEDQPLRGGFGVLARLRSVWVAGSVLGHPVLGETFRAAIGVGGER